MSARILVVGGAGYIGSITARALLASGHEVVTWDDLSTGHAAAVQGPLVRGDVRDRAALTATLRTGFDAVLHFAARIAVGESVQRPGEYYDVNVGGTLSLLACMAEAGVRSLVYSSTAAVYGSPRHLPIVEDHPHAPESPYGHSKAICEQVLADLRAAGELRATVLRYFNAAGAAEDGTLGEAHPVETHLIPLAIDATLGRRPPLTVFGQDWDTPDGTCLRDYVHVDDLARAHVATLERLLQGDAGTAYNVGTGTGTTVRQVLDAVGRALGRPVPHTLGARRPGDAVSLVADPSRIRAELGWEARAGIDEIVRTAARWARRPAFGPSRTG